MRKKLKTVGERLAAAFAITMVVTFVLVVVGGGLYFALKDNAPALSPFQLPSYSK